MDPNLANLTSVGAVAALTLFLVSMLKPTIAATRYLQRVPLWLYAVLVSVGLTYLANRVLFTLPGNLAQLAMNAAVSALTGMGFRAAAANFTKPAEHSVAPAADDDDDDENGPSGPAIDVRGFAVALVAAGLLMGAGGCLSGLGRVARPVTPAEKARSARILYLAANAAFDHVEIKDRATAQQIKDLRDAARAAMETYERALLAGDADVDAERKAWDAAIERFLKLGEELGAPKPAVTVSPSVGAPAP